MSEAFIDLVQFALITLLFFLRMQDSKEPCEHGQNCVIPPPCGCNYPTLTDRLCESAKDFQKPNA